MIDLNAHSQSENALIRKGNQYYKNRQMDLSQQQYREALKLDPGNSTANYNLGNTQFRKNNFGDAGKTYERVIEHSDNKNLKEKAYYNKGVTSVQDQKLQESIDSWKNALKLDPADSDAREKSAESIAGIKKETNAGSKTRSETGSKKAEPATATT